MQMPDKTKEAIIHRYLTEGTFPTHKARGGAITVKYNQSKILPFLIDLISEDCTISLEKMQEKLTQHRDELDLQDSIPSDTTISNWLVDALYSVKKPLISPEKRNFEEVINERH